ncbi:MAG TPA: hypothetical protein VNN15_06430, partial [Solirubrobacterales bacterium]|nr:hypothetical protein [Solirubrobacterales bacterium]
MERARKIKAVVATAAATAALAVPVAVARAEAETAAVPAAEPTPLEAPANPVPASPITPEPEADTAPAGGNDGVKHGTTLVPPPVPATKTPPSSGGVSPGGDQSEPSESAPEATETEAGAVPAPTTTPFSIPSLPASSCAINGVPPVLIPIYQRASNQYALGPQGPAILAGINAIETAFGTNLGPSSAGAVGWMQFMPETWAMYG